MHGTCIPFMIRGDFEPKILEACDPFKTILAAHDPRLFFVGMVYEHNLGFGAIDTS